MMSQSGTKSNVVFANSEHPVVRVEGPSAGLLPQPILAATLVLAVLAAVLLAYSPVCFSFFAGDDFVHLTWLHEAVRNPELIWRNFHSSWLDGTTTQFYRPLISLFMVADYLLWGLNGLGFRATNLLFHLASSVFLYFIVRDLGKADTTGSARRSATTRWAIAASALFALYPLHPEAVSWITGRVDSIVTAFCLLSLWCYMRWGQKGNPFWMLGAGLAMMLGLLSKEMAITLPFVFLAYEMLLGGSTHKRSAPLPADLGPPVRRPLQELFAVIGPVLPFFLLLGVYFGIRMAALGTCVGGYDNSLFFIADRKGLLLSWIHGLRMMVIPINKEFLGSHSALTTLWQIGIGLSAILGSMVVLRDRAMIRPLGFLILWLGLSMLPVYKIFGIGDDLQASRLAYLATAPLCVLMTMGYACWPDTHFRRRFFTALLTVMLICATALLFQNNQAWAVAGRESNAIVANFNKLYKDVSGDPEVLVVGLPDELHGAYVCRNAVSGMTKYPQIHRDVKQCLMLDRNDPIFPFGYLKESLFSCQDKVKLYRWSGAARGLMPISIDGGDRPAPSGSFYGKALAGVATPIPAKTTNFAFKPDGTLLALGGPHKLKGRPQIKVDLSGLPCWKLEFITLSMRHSSAEAKGGKAVDLFYANTHFPKIVLERRAHAELKPFAGEQEVILPLRAEPDWALGGISAPMKLLLPENCQVEVLGLKLTPAEQVMPSIHFAESGYLNSKGFMHLSKASPTGSLTYDARRVPQSAGIVLEITRANLFFENRNSQQPSRYVGRTIRCDTTSGALTLKREEFPAQGLYEARARAINSAGEPLGVAGDHIVISVDP